MPSLSAAVGRRIGLLGGSFNPAHGGHLHISLRALDELGLDEVWWLVSPQNPLKSEAGMAPLADRLASAKAKAVAAGRPITATDIERELGTVYSADTVEALKRRYPDASFVWIMGADNLCQVHRWRDWRRLFRSVPVAVLPRPSYSLRAERSKAARRFARHRLKSYRATALAERRPPAWILLRSRLDPASATAIRARLGGS